MNRMPHCAPAILIGLLATPLAGQGGGRSVVLGGYAGAYTHLVNFNNAGTADFRPSYNVGATLGLQLSPYVGIHADVTYTRSTARGLTTFGGGDFNRLFYGAHLELRYPVEAYATFVFLGGGAISIDELGKTGTIAPFTKVAGTFGGGLAYAIPRSRTEVFGEVKGLVYNWDRGMIYQGQVGGPFAGSRINTTLVDVTIAVGLSYRFVP
jgi:hypothetical protein